MNKYSLLCKYISSNDQWLDELPHKYNIDVKVEGDLAIFNYGLGADFSVPLVQEARGIIINIQTFDVICWPFRKFGNWNESYADEIDWEYAVATKKIDGSIIKLFWNEDHWQFATNRTINADDAEVAGKHCTFGRIIRQADNYDDIDFESLDKDITYIFELISPITTVVINYGRTHLYHIGTRNNITGQESNDDIGIEKPERIRIGSLDACMKNVELMNRGDYVTEEGYVVVDKNWNRIKVKSPKYLILHSAIANHSNSKKRIIHAIMIDKFDAIMTADPFTKVATAYYMYKIEELRMEVRVFMDYVRALYEEVSGDRYAVYEAIKDHRLAHFGLKGMDKDMDSDGIVNALYKTRRETFLRLIPDYNIDYDKIIKGEN